MSDGTDSRSHGAKITCVNEDHTKSDEIEHTESCEQDMENFLKEIERWIRGSSKTLGDHLPPIYKHESSTSLVNQRSRDRQYHGVYLIRKSSKHIGSTCIAMVWKKKQTALTGITTFMILIAMRYHLVRCQFHQNSGRRPPNQVRRWKRRTYSCRQPRVNQTARIPTQATWMRSNGAYARSRAEWRPAYDLVGRILRISGT